MKSSSAIRVFILVSLFISLFTCEARAQSNRILRICLNNNDTVATLSWTGFSNSCNTFTRAEIWGRKQSEPFTFLFTYPSNSGADIPVKLPALDQTWQFYCLVLAPCNGQDSFLSDTVFLDIIKPPLSEIDSVSILHSTQELIVGWSPNPAVDVKGYRIYRYSGAINDSIGDTNSLFFKPRIFNSLSGPDLSIAAYDSCNLYSPISPPHRPIVLSLSNNSDCHDSATLNWSPYMGWGNSLNYRLFKSTNASSYTQINTGVNTAFVDTGLKYGDSVCYFARAFHPTKNMSTSSNIVCYKRWSPNRDPDFQILLFGAVEADDAMRVVFTHTTGSDIARSELLFQAPSGNTRFTKTPIEADELSGAFTYYELTINQPTHQAYAITLEGFDKCGQALSGLQQTQNPVLTLTDKTLNWNPFSLWSESISPEQNILMNESRSTWNNIKTTSFSNNSYNTEAVEVNDYTCFRVSKGKPGTPNNTPLFHYPSDLTHYSNIVCRTGSLTAYVPTAISLGGQNNRLYVVGNGIDRDKSTLIVFNRWGEQIFRANLNESWNPEPNILPGVYFYQATVWGFNGEKKNMQGPIYIIE